MGERLKCGRETKCEVRENKDNTGLKKLRSGTDREINRAKERGDRDTTDKQMDAMSSW